MNTLVTDTKPSFDVLDRNTQIYRHAIIEASAGTGKTFAIENIVVRLLIGEDKAPLPLDRILVVTFTRAAARDLKKRIRSNIEKILNQCSTFVSKGETSQQAPDYILPILDLGVEQVRIKMRRLEEALFSFDQAKIFTIHGFCWRMLKTFAVEGVVSLEAVSKEEQPQSVEKVEHALRDFIRTRLNEQLYSREQLKILLKKFNFKVDDLLTALKKIAVSSTPIAPSRPIQELLPLFLNAMQRLKNLHGFTAQWVEESIHQLALYFKDMTFLKSKEPHKNLKKIARFCPLFDKASWTKEDLDVLVADGLYILKAFETEKIMKKFEGKAEEILAHPLIASLSKELYPIVEEAGDYSHILSRVVCDCQSFIRYYQQEEEVFGHDDLLVKMEEAASIKPFANSVRSAFNAVIIDEFQDTDPLQWQLLSKLFLDKHNSWNGIFQIVGDPKQSIYAFRQADIYTYLEAAKRLGEASQSTLDRNYRSQPTLIDGLNALFSAVDNLFPLPKINSTLPYNPVKAGISKEMLFSDRLPNIQFWVVKDEDSKKRRGSTYAKECETFFLFPAILQEIKRLHREEGVKYSQCAVLISDKFQSSRFVEYCQIHSVPVRSQKNESLADSTAIEAMREVIDGILHYKKSSALKAALAGPVIAMTLPAILEMGDERNEKLASLLAKCDSLRKLLVEEGFGPFYSHLMNSCWNDDGQTVQEKLLYRKDGEQFYREFCHIAELLMTEEDRSRDNKEWLTSFLDALEKEEDPRLQSYIDPDQEGVTVLTNHSSKGLEYDVVFTLGLVTRHSIKDQFILSQKGEKQLVPLKKEDPNYDKFLDEIDAEKMRQLYVVLTRAKLRLYIPIVIDPSEKDVEKGTAAPIELLLAKLDNAATPLYTKIKELSVEPLIALQQAHQNLFYLKMLKRDVIGMNKEVRQAPLLLPPATFDIPGKPISIESFTSLSRHSTTEEEQSEEKRKAPCDIKAADKTPFTLPSGKEIGVVLHSLLETIPFNMADASCLLPYAAENLRSTPYYEWKEAIAEILWNALTVKLDGQFCLADVDPKKVFREKDFLYLSSPEISHSGYVKGVIDLFFEHQGKYYLLDWKSNWLGPKIEDYQKPFLDIAMKQNQYDLQARLYKEALKRYLSLFGIDFEKRFGGVYYLFLRGLGNGSGIWSG